MLRYSDVYTYVNAGLTAKGYGAQGGPEMPLIDPGPFTVARLQKRTPGPMLFLVVGNGVGVTQEAVFDRPFITVRAIGRQNDYDYAETLAHDVDAILLAAGGNTLVGATTALYITRTGGSPQLVDFDDGDRYHYQQTYITEVQR